MKSLQQLGEELLKLTDKDLATIPISELLAEALQLAHKIRNKHEAYRRQLQYIGKVMRSEDLEAIEAALLVIKRKAHVANDKFHHLEKTRDKLIAEGDSAINQLVAEYSQLDRQKLRQLIRNANKEKANNKPPKAYRELFKYLREQLDA